MLSISWSRSCTLSLVGAWITASECYFFFLFSFHRDQRDREKVNWVSGFS
jgi:hypothetical protein